MYDVIITGAGPAGSLAAHRLASLGHKIAVVEEHEEVGEAISCTGLVGKECFDVFGLPAGIILNQASAARFFAPSGWSLLLQKQTTQAYMVDRAALDRALAERAQQAGAEYILASPVRDMGQVDGFLRLELEHRGRALSLETRAAILACGPTCPLPQKLGLGEIGDRVTGAQVEVATRDGQELELYFGQKLAPGFFAWLVPTSPGLAWAGLLSRRRPDFYLNEFLSRLQREGKIASPQGPTTYGVVPLLPRPRTYGQGVLVVGDAAGQVKPTTAGGIYFGLLSAEMAAQTLHHALEAGDLSPRRLAAYERGWKKKLAQELQVGYWARKIFERLGDRQIEEVMRFIHLSGFDQALLERDGLSFDWHSRSILQALGHGALPPFLRAMIGSVFPPKKNPT